MTEKGFVEKTENGIVYVAAVSAGCGGCKATCIGCGKKRIVKAVSEEKLTQGEEVLLVTSDSVLYKLMLAVLFVPLVLLIASYLIISPAFSSATPPALISIGISGVYLIIFAVIAKAGNAFLPKAIKPAETDIFFK